MFTEEMHNTMNTASGVPIFTFQFLISLSVVSEARVSKLHTRARCVCALSIQRLEGGRWRLRRMRARGTRSNGYGNSIFSLICKLLVLRYLENEHVREPQLDALR